MTPEFITGSVVDFIKDLLAAVPWLLVGIVGVAFVAAVALCVLALLGSLVGWLFLSAENSVVEKRDMVVPTVFTLFAALGAATVSAAELPTAAAFVFAVIVAGMMFISTAVRRAGTSERAQTAAKFLGSAGVLFGPAVSVAYLLSRTDLSKLSVDNWVVLIGSALILLAGIAAAFVFRRQGLAPT